MFLASIIIIATISYYCFYYYYCYYYCDRVELLFWRCFQLLRISEAYERTLAGSDSQRCSAKEMGDFLGRTHTNSIAKMRKHGGLSNEKVYQHMGLSENVVYPEKPNGFYDHYPVSKWLFHWGYTPFSDIPIYKTRNMFEILGLVDGFAQTNLQVVLPFNSLSHFSMGQ